MVKLADGFFDSINRAFVLLVVLLFEILGASGLLVDVLGCFVSIGKALLKRWERRFPMDAPCGKVLRRDRV